MTIRDASVTYLERALLTVLQLRSKMNKKTSKIIISQTKNLKIMMKKKNIMMKSRNQRSQRMRLNLITRMRSSPITGTKMETLMS